MKKHLIVSLLGLFLVSASTAVSAQKTTTPAVQKAGLATATARPKLVVGIVVGHFD